LDRQSTEAIIFSWRKLWSDYICARTEVLKKENSVSRKSFIFSDKWSGEWPLSVRMSVIYKNWKRTCKGDDTVLKFGHGCKMWLIYRHWYLSVRHNPPSNIVRKEI
jgi:hypothetical protein